MSCIDVTFASSTLAAKCNWRVVNNTLGSDHCPTVTTFHESAVYDTAFTPKWKLDSADWKQFKENCRQLITPQVVSDDVNVFNDRLSAAIITAAETSIKQTKNSKKRIRPLPYCTKKIKEAVYVRNKARNKMNKSKDLNDCINYRRLKGIAQAGEG